MSSLAGRRADLADQRAGLALDPAQHRDAEGEGERRAAVPTVSSATRGDQLQQPRAAPASATLHDRASRDRGARADGRTSGRSAGSAARWPPAPCHRRRAAGRRSWSRVSKASACSSGPGSARWCGTLRQSPSSIAVAPISTVLPATSAGSKRPTITSTKLSVGIVAGSMLKSTSNGPAPRAAPPNSQTGIVGTTRPRHDAVVGTCRIRPSGSG